MDSRVWLADQPFVKHEETSKDTDPLREGTSRVFSLVGDAKSVIRAPAYNMRIGGLGVGDHLPVKGQLTFLVPQPEVDYQFGCNPRADGIALGSTREPNVWSLEPDPEARQRIVDRAIERFAAMRAPDPTLQLTRSRAPAAVPGVESFFGVES